MRNALPLSLASLAFLGGCSFQMHAGTDPQRPGQAAPPAQTGGPRGIGKRTIGPSGPTPAPSAQTPTVTPSSSLTAAMIFGNNAVDASGWRGAVYWLPPGTTKLPTLTSMTPNGALNIHELNIAPQTFTGGFPGLDSTHNSNFAIRYEAALSVSTEADYDFHIVADDGAVLRIDNTLIVDNDGAKTTAASKEGPVHLLVGTHAISVDYFQATGPVALQVFCKKFGDVERICPTSL